MAKQDNASSGEGNGKPDRPTEQAAGNPGEGGAQGSAAGQPSGAAAGASQATDAVALLKADHRKVEGLFAKYQTATSGKDEIVRQICMELTVHTALEEEIFYPACRRAASDEEPLDEAQVEHDSAKMLIADLSNSSARDRFRDAKVSVLSEQIKHHVGEEEAPSRGIFAKAQAAGVNTPELAKRIQARKQELMAEPDDLPQPRPVSFQVSQFLTGRNKEDNMANYRGNDRERDERGRFADDDDRGRYSARGGRDDDDGRRGWYGDPRGHSEASRRGWEERRGESRSFSRDDDDDRRYGRERDERGRFTDEDDERRYRSQAADRDRDERARYADEDRRYAEGRGWYGESRGHAEAARRGWEERDDGRRYRDDDDDRRGRGRGGWFGDSRGHAEAARRGWDERDEGRRLRDDDDRRGGRGQGGWFGDSRGHAEAARRGWEDRR